MYSFLLFFVEIFIHFDQILQMFGNVCYFNRETAETLCWNQKMNLKKYVNFSITCVKIKLFNYIFSITYTTKIYDIETKQLKKETKKRLHFSSMLHCVYTAQTFNATAIKIGYFDFPNFVYNRPLLLGKLQNLFLLRCLILKRKSTKKGCNCHGLP